jgi:hypothetical protein
MKELQDLKDFDDTRRGQFFMKYVMAKLPLSFVATLDQGHKTTPLPGPHSRPAHRALWWSYTHVL